MQLFYASPIPAHAVHTSDLYYLDRDIRHVLEKTPDYWGWHYLPLDHFFEDYYGISTHESQTLRFEYKNRRWVQREGCFHATDPRDEILCFRCISVPRDHAWEEPPKEPPAPEPMILPLAPPPQWVDLSLRLIGDHPIEESWGLSPLRVYTLKDKAMHFNQYLPGHRVKRLENAEGKSIDLWVESTGYLQIVCPNKNQPSSQVAISQAQDQHHYRFHALFPPIFLATSTKGRFYKTHFSPAEIAYFKRQGNNATLFIHGFNVSEGEHGELPDVEFYAKNTVMTDDPSLSDRNGTGAAAWAVHLEMQLNRAAGFTGDYLSGDYTRLVSVSWDGDVAPMNYIEAEHHAHEAGIKLCAALKQLCDEKITVNIIAHSLGNRVLLSALHHLISFHGPAYQKAINHAFLWQPAVPDTALSTNPLDDTSFLQNWQYVHATQAVDHITVLSSQNDAVLGPMFEDGQQKAGINFIKKVIQFYTKGQSASAYEIASLIGVPGKQLKDRFGFNQWYDQWRERYPKMVSGKPFPSDPTKLIPPSDLSFNLEILKLVGNLVDVMVVLYATDYGSGVRPRKALGWGGAKADTHLDKMQKTGKYHEVNQTEWLFDHSGMKIPTPDVFQKSYVEGIIETEGRYKFGKYPEKFEGLKRCSN